MADAKDTLKAAVRRLLNAVGYDIVGYDSQNPRTRLSRLLRRHRITTVFDVGASRGAFGWDIRELGFKGEIVSFEPLKDAFALLEEATRQDPKWKAVNVALGACDEERTIYVAANSQSSSLFPMLETHKQAAPESLYEREQRTPVRRLDGIFSDYCSSSAKVFLKIDAQGFEKEVLLGAGAILAAAPLVQLECSLVPLYDGAGTMEDMIGMMRGWGYDPIDILPTFYHRESKHLMQVDTLFLRREC